MFRFFVALVFVGCQQDPHPAVEVATPLAIDAPVQLAGKLLAPAAVKALVAGVNPAHQGGVVYCAYQPLASDDDKAYLWVLCDELAPGRDDILSGASLPVVLDATGIHVPGDGGQYVKDLRRMFPARVLPLLDPSNARVMALEAAALADRRVATRTPDAHAPPGPTPPR